MQAAKGAAKAMFRFGKKAATATAGATDAPPELLPPAPTKEVALPHEPLDSEMEHTEKVVVLTEPPPEYFARGGSLEAWAEFEKHTFFTANKASWPSINEEMMNVARRATRGSGPYPAGAVDAALKLRGEELQGLFRRVTGIMATLTCMAADAAELEADDLKDDVPAFLRGKQASINKDVEQARETLFKSVVQHRLRVVDLYEAFSMSRTLCGMADDQERFPPTLEAVLEDEDRSFAIGMPDVIRSIDPDTFRPCELHVQPDKRRCYTFLGAALCRYHLDDIRALGGVNFFYVLNATKIDCLAPAFKEQRELLAHSMERLLQLRAVKQAMDDDVHGSTAKLISGLLDVLPHLLNGQIDDYTHISTPLLVELQRAIANYNSAAVLAVGEKADKAASKANRAAEVAKASADVSRMTYRRLAALEHQVKVLTGSKRKLVAGNSDSDSEGEAERAAKRRTPTLPQRYQATREAMAAAGNSAPRSALQERNFMSINSHPLATLAAAKMSAPASQPAPAVAAAVAAAPAAGWRAMPEPVGVAPQAATVGGSEEEDHVMEV